MKKLSPILLLLLLVFATYENANAQVIDEKSMMQYQPRTLVIAGNYDNYKDAKKLAESLSTRFDWLLNYRNLYESKRVGQPSLLRKYESKDADYDVRGRWDNGVYISIEHTSVYYQIDSTLKPFLVVIASGDSLDEVIFNSILKRLQEACPNAQKINVVIKM